MKSLFLLGGLFSLALFAEVISARKDPNHSASSGNNDAKVEEEKLFTDEFKRKTNIWVYNDDPKPEQKSFFRKEFETKPGFWVYGDDDSKSRDVNLFTKDFETKSGFWVYSEREEKPLRKEFGVTRPNLWVYNDEGKVKEEKSFTN